jgi:hypothetical protein
MTITLQSRQRSSNKSCYIYYNDWTGEILSVGHSVRPESPAPYFQCEDLAAQEIIDGTKSDKNYIVNIDVEVGAHLAKKSKYLQLTQKEQVLYLLPEKVLPVWDIRATIYKTNATLLIEINHDMVSRLVAEHRRHEASMNDDVVFKFYVIRKHMPDCLLKVIDVDVKLLIEQGHVTASLSDLNQFAGLNDVAIMTCRQFEHYCLSVTDNKYVDNDIATVLRTKDKKWQVVQADIESHIELIQTGNQIEIKSIVDTEQLTATGLHQRQLVFYIVGDTPDKYHDYLTINVSELRMGKTMKFIIDFDIMDMNIIYHNRLLKVNKRTIHDTDPD